jgi:hypothetical protein
MIFLIQVTGLQSTTVIKINNDVIKTDTGCLCVYDKHTTVLYYNAYDSTTFQESGYLRVSVISTTVQIILDHTNKGFINYSFPITITPFKIKNELFDPTIKNPSPDNDWYIYVAHGVEASDLNIMIGCRNSLQSDKLWVFDNDPWSKYFFLAKDKDGTLITHTGKRVPVYPGPSIRFNIDDNIVDNINYDFSDVWFGNSKLFINNCNPLTTFKSCTKLIWCRKFLLIDYKDPTETPRSFIYNNCTGDPCDYSDNNGLVKDIVLNNNAFYGFTIQEESELDIKYSAAELTKQHQLIHITESQINNLEFNFIVNNGNLDIQDVDQVSVQLRGYCNSSENCTENSDLFNKTWDDIRDFIKDPLLKRMYIGKYNLKLINKTTGQMILNEHYTFCTDTIFDAYFTYHDYTNYIDCGLALPNAPDGQIDPNMVRSDGTITYNEYLWYNIRTWLPNPQNLITLYPGDSCDNKMSLDWSKHTYYTLSASVKSTIEYFVQCSIEWWHNGDTKTYHITYGDITSTFTNNDVYITTDRPADYKNDDYVILKVNRVADPYNNVEIVSNEEYRIRAINFYYGNKRIFTSPCLYQTDDCWFEFNGIPSYLWGITTDPIEEEMLSAVTVEKYNNSSFDGTQFGKASYDATVMKIQCYIDISGRPLLTWEDNFEVVFREYLYNKRDSNGLLKNNYLTVSYSDRIYRGFISGAQDIKIDADKGNGSFVLEFTVPDGIFYEEYDNEWGVDDYKQFDFNQILLPVIWIYPKVGVLNLTITDNLTKERMIIAGFNLTSVDENSRLVVDCPNKEVYYNRIRITDKIPFLYNFLELDSQYDLSLTDGYTLDGVKGGMYRIKNY